MNKDIYNKSSFTCFFFGTDFDTAEAANKAIVTMDAVPMGGQKIRVGMAVTFDAVPEEVGFFN